MSEKQVKGWDLEELKPVKEWIIQDFTPYRIKNEHLLVHVAFLYHEVDPAFDQLGNTWWVHPFFRDRCTAPYFRKIGTDEIYYYTDVADPIEKDNNMVAPDWKGIPPGKRHSRPRTQREDMEPYLGPLGPIDEAKKQGVYHATKIEMKYHEIWGEIEKTYNHLLTAAKEGTLPIRNSTGYETDFSATRDDLKRFFIEILGNKPRFLFSDGTANRQNDFIPGQGFRSVTWKGNEYSFTGRQAQVIEALYIAFQKGTPDVGQDYILEEILNTRSSRLRDTFQGNPAWGKLIVKGKTSGTYCLNL